jgi:pyruvate dehydrogenase E2 component (dihydrolipoamide acetyltransferase)
MAEFRMPSLGADMEAGRLDEWLVKPGDAVKRGQVVAVVETDKGAIEIEIWQEGVVERLLVGTGERVPVGTPLALLSGAGSDAVPSVPVTAPGVEAPAPQRVPPAAPRTPSPSAAAVPVGARARISPAARRRAAELGIDPASVPPGADGSVALEDIERAAQARGATPSPAPPPAPVTAAAPRAPGEDWQAQMRRAIAAAMSRSKREIPHYYLATDIVVGPLLDWLAGENLRRDVSARLLPVVPMMKAVARALAEVPELNGTYTEGVFHPSPAVHLGMAIAMRGGGLVAPAIHDAAALDLDELMARLRDLIQRVRGGRLRSSELADPTITLTSLGEQGVEEVYGVIYPPQVAIVGLGRVVERPWVVDGTVAVRRVLRATLAADHRVSDGHRGALYLAALARQLQDPEALR